MVRPHEMTLELPMEIAGGTISTTTMVWKILMASRDGDLTRVKAMISDCVDLAYAQYNYTPPIHFAVREGHVDLVKFLLGLGAYDITYRIYPFLDDLTTIATDRNHNEILALLNEYHDHPEAWRFKGDNGKIDYQRSEMATAFEQAVDAGDLNETALLLKKEPDLIKDKTYFWGEGILMMPAKDGNREMLELLLDHGAQFPVLLKWAQFYYFERYEIASFLMQKGLNSNLKSWQSVTLLHDMAQKGEIQKAELLIRYGADMEAIDDEYLSTPLGMAARWGHKDMVCLLLDSGADPNRSGASWSTALNWARKKAHIEVEALLINGGAK